MQQNKSAVIIICSVLFLAGCDTLSKLQNVWLDSVTLVMDQDANNDSATSIDLVFFLKQDLMDKVAKMTAFEYYNSVEQLVKDNPKMIQIVRWELAPGQSKLDEKIEGIEGSPLGAIVFASYTSPGDHRVILGLQHDIIITLKANDFIITEKEAKE